MHLWRLEFWILKKSVNGCNKEKTDTGLLVLSWHYTPTFSILAQYLYSGPSIKKYRRIG